MPPTMPNAIAPYARREPYGAYFSGLTEAAGPAAAVRCLVVYLEAALDGAERVALWNALWHGVRRLPGADFERIAACLDGRHAAALQALLARRWDDPVLIERLCTQGSAEVRAALTPALLAHHGLDPLGDPHRFSPVLLLEVVRAVLADKPLAIRRAAQLQVAIEVLVQADATLLAPALTLLFDLALLTADEATATRVLATLLHRGEAGGLSPERVRSWLDGSAFAGEDDDRTPPLQLGPGLQPAWLRPAHWGSPAALNGLQQALTRTAPRARLQALIAAVTELGWPSRPVQPLASDALRLLALLDRAYGLAAQGQDPVPPLRVVLQRALIAPAAIAFLWRASARSHAARGDTESELLALTQARRHHADAALLAEIARRLPPQAPSPSGDWREEEPGWLTLLQQGDAAARRVAALQLATLYTDGELQPRSPHRCQHLDRARGLWQRLQTESVYAPLADAALDDPLARIMVPALRHAHGEDYLWFERPGACGVFIVFSCMASYHTYPEVQLLREALKDRHLMFVRCPDRDWYSDATYDRVHALLREQVASRFAPSQVSCWYGSKGGTGALKFGLTFGWQAIVFNPQTSLDLWAAFRPGQREQLWRAERRASLDAWPVQAWEAMPLYYACGAWTADREALSFAIRLLRRCRRLDAIIEKYDDANHAGLMHRIATGGVPATLEQISQRLSALGGAAEPGPGWNASDADDFWDQLDALRAGKVEVRVREGRLWWKPSLLTGTR